MAGRATYTDAHKAAVYVALASNEQNIKRTARETGVPPATIRRWRSDWAIDGPPSTDPGSPVFEAIEDFVEESRSIRDYALSVLRTKIPQANPAQLIAIIGVLDDKSTRAAGLATTRTEHIHTLPSAEELKALMGEATRQIAEATVIREEEIIDAEDSNQPPRALLPAT